MLSRIVAADGAICEGSGESVWVGGVEEVGNVEGGRGEAVKDANRPALGGEAAVPDADVALCVGVHVGVA